MAAVSGGITVVNEDSAWVDPVLRATSRNTIESEKTFAWRQKAQVSVFSLSRLSGARRFDRLSFFAPI